MAEDPGTAKRVPPEDANLQRIEPHKGSTQHGGRCPLKDLELKHTLNLISPKPKTRSNDGDADDTQKDERAILSPEPGILNISTTRRLSAIPQHTEGVVRGILLDCVRPLHGITRQVFPYNNDNILSDTSGVGSCKLLGTVAEDETPGSEGRSRLTDSKSATESRAVSGELDNQRPGTKATRSTPSVVDSLSRSSATVVGSLVKLIPTVNKSTTQ